MAGMLSNLRYTSRRRTRSVANLAEVALLGPPSPCPGRGVPVTQSISPRLQASSFFWYEGGYKKEASGVVAKVVRRAMTTKIVKVLVLRIFACRPMFCTGFRSQHLLYLLSRT